MIKSRFPYGLAGWITVQVYLTAIGKFDPFGAMMSLALIFVVIVGTERLAWWVVKRRKK